MNTLRLLIDAGWPQRHVDCRWYLCAPDGSVLRHGHDVPAHWPGVHPQAATPQPHAGPPVCDLILDSSQTACFRVTLPKGAGHAEQAAIGAALEAVLLDDPEQYQFLKLSQENREGPAECTVAVLSRLRLQSLLQQMGELGLPVRSVWPEGALLPGAPAGEGLAGTTTPVTGRCAWLAPGRLTLPLPAGGFLGLDAGETLPETLRHLAPKLALPALTVCSLEPVDPAWLQGWQAALGIPVQGWQPAAATFPLQAPAAAGFLHGPFAPARQLAPLWQQGRLLLRHLGMTGGILLLLLLLQWGVWTIGANGVRQDMATLFRQQFPQAVMVDPLLQIRRQLAQQQARRGLLQAGDFLFLLDRLSAQLDPAPYPMHYTTGRLQLELTLDAGRYHSLLRALSAQGLFVRGKGDIRAGRFAGTLTVSATSPDSGPDHSAPEKRKMP